MPGAANQGKIMFKQQLMFGAAMAALGFATSATAQTAPVATAAASAASDAATEVVVYGRGQTRQIQTITPKQIEQAAPGTSAIKVLATLPGVNFQSSDPFGAYEWSTRISVRGFNQNQMGFTLDGVPLGDMSYGNYNGLHISRAISSENIGDTQLAEGTGALGTASSSNLGGTVEFTSIDPAHKMGALVEGGYGSYDSQREFVRLDSGELPGGGAGYFSFGNQNSQKWKGYGRQKQQQFNTKFVQPIGDTAKVTAFFNYSDRRENDYQDLDMRWIKQFGYSLDNISHNFPLAVALANTYNFNQANPTNPEPYPAPFTNTPDAIDAVYYNASGLRQDGIGAVKVDWDIIEGLSLHVQGYAHHNHGEGTWFLPYVPTSVEVPLSVRTTEYDIARNGVISSLEYRIAGHDIEGGVWCEDNDFNNARRFYDLNATGTNRNSLEFQQNPFATQWYGKFNTKTLQFHLQDTWKITDDLKLNVGFKALDVDVKAAQEIVTLKTPAAGEIKSDEGFLPQVGVNYTFDKSNEVFADYAKNMRALGGANVAPSPFSATQVNFDAFKSKLKPETSQTGEVGYRYHAGALQGSVVAYYVKFDNRLLVLPVGSGAQGSPNVLENVGSVTSKGIELSGSWKFMTNWSITGSYAYDKSTYDNNVLSPAGVLLMSTAGKTEVDAPEHIANAALGYDDGSLFGSVDVSAMTKRYYTYENDRSVPGRALVDLSFGYRFHQDGWLKDLEIQGNVTNLFDEKYVSTIGTNGFGASGDNDTLQAGSPIEAFVTVKKKF